MNRRLTLRPQAEVEIGEAAVWYEGCGAGLGNDFLRAVDAAVAAIQRNPFSVSDRIGRAATPISVQPDLSLSRPGNYCGCVRSWSA
jgi:hypothetical protein